MCTKCIKNIHVSYVAEGNATLYFFILLLFIYIIYTKVYYPAGLLICLLIRLLFCLLIGSVSLRENAVNTAFLGCRLLVDPLVILLVDLLVDAHLLFVDLHVDRDLVNRKKPLFTAFLNNVQLVGLFVDPLVARMSSESFTFSLKMHKNFLRFEQK